ncbi:hypothetical protein HSEST_2446 [Halapricum desulfuricans]|uniref:Uncharacterized protein n=1 Tax=Halapricum desulfuricans TaxID=2841257 RepID=A0A897P124_9EURY|nr:hypothetical protein HSEST_2446 [Halapricum desulfuricans]
MTSVLTSLCLYCEGDYIVEFVLDGWKAFSDSDIRSDLSLCVDRNTGNKVPYLRYTYIYSRCSM